MKIYGISNATPSFRARIIKNEEMENTKNYVKNNCSAETMNNFINAINSIKRSHKFNNFELKTINNSACILVNNRIISSKTQTNKNKKIEEYYIKAINEFVHNPMCMDKIDLVNIKQKNVPELDQIAVLKEIRKSLTKNAISKLRTKIDECDPYNGNEGYEPLDSKMWPFKRKIEYYEDLY